MTNSGIRNNMWDSLKGWAILGVILVHSGSENFPGIIGDIVVSGSRGVQMFFIISAYLTFVSLGKIVNDEGNFDKGVLSRWYFKKFVRLMPIYYLFNIVFFANKWPRAELLARNFPGISIFNILSNFLFIHGLNPFYINSININWYIGDLAIFIVIAPWLCKKINTASKAVIITLSSSMVCYWIYKILSAGFIVNTGENAYIWDAYFENLSILAQFPIIMLGIVLYFFIEKERSLVNADNKLLSNVITAFCAYIMLVGLIMRKNTLGFSFLFLWGICFAGIIIAQTIHKNPLIVNPAIGKLGQYSYGIYLSHRLILSWLYGTFQSTAQNPIVFQLICIVITIVCSYFISYLCVKFLEEPFVSFAGTLIRKK